MLARGLLALVLASGATSALAQTPEAPPDSSAAPSEPAEVEIFEVVEQAPTLVGGLADLQRRVRYPEAARAAGIEGKVFVQFIVSETGEVRNAQAIRCPDFSLCEEAIRVIRGSQFLPGRQRGQPVPVLYTLPVEFLLSGPDRTPTYESTEQMPEPIGGEEAITARAHALARAAGVRARGRVVVEFVVGEDGAPRQARCFRSPNRLLCRAAVRAVEEARFHPGEQRGRAVPVQTALAIDFE